MNARRQHNILAASLATALTVLGAAQARSREPTPNDDQARQERLAQMKAQVAEYTLKLTDNDSSPLTLHEEAVLRFSNPVSGVPDGIVAMWKAGRRPAVFAQVFQTKDGLWVHECQSLAAAGLTMHRGDKLFWQPQEPAEAFRRLENAPLPSAGAARRLVQMKSLAAEFSAADDFKIRTQDKETTRHELRLLTTPIYRYDDAGAGITDAAAFAFVHGTDPEVFLVLEARTDRDGRSDWHYLLAPMTCWAVTVKHRGREVWSLPERLNKSTPRDAYHVWLYQP
jgi:hypothetical protein